MPFDGSGTYNRNFPSGGWAGDAAANIKIRADRHDTHDADIAAALSLMICKDGQSAPSADINWNGKKLLNLATPTAATDAATKGYVDGVRNFSSAISITGSLPESLLKFTGSTGPWGLSFTGPTATFGMRANDWVWNNAVDFSGVDVMTLTQGAHLTVKGPPANSALISLDKGAGSASLSNVIYGRTATSVRWQMDLGDAVAEAGADAGSNFRLLSYNDAGAGAVVRLSIARATGIVAMPAGATTLTQTAGNNTTAVATTAFVKAAVDTGDALQVLKAGDTMTGGLIIKPASYATLVLDKPVGAFGNYVGGKVNNLFRWVMYLGTPTAESSGNVGSDFTLNRYDDAGVVIAGAAPLNIYRSTGFAVFGGEVTATGSLRTKAIGAGNAALYLTDSDGTTERALIYSNPAGDLLFRYGKSSYTASLSDTSGSLSVPTDIILNAELGGVKLNAAGTTSLFQSSGGVYLNTNTGTFLQGMIATRDWAIYTDSAQRVLVQASTGYLVAQVNGQKPGGGDWLTLSDARVKTVLGDYGSGLAAIMALHPVRYTYKGNDTPAVPDNSIPDPMADPDAERDTTPATVPYRNSVHYTAASNDTEYVGLIAQEAETVMPSLVTLSEGWIDGQPVTDLRNLDTTELTFTLINAVKELAARIEALETA